MECYTPACYHAATRVSHSWGGWGFNFNWSRPCHTTRFWYGKTSHLLHQHLFYPGIIQLNLRVMIFWPHRSRPCRRWGPFYALVILYNTYNTSSKITGMRGAKSGGRPPRRAALVENSKYKGGFAAAGWRRLGSAHARDYRGCIGKSRPQMRQCCRGVHTLQINRVWMKRKETLNGIRFDEPATILPSGTRWRTVADAAATTEV